MHGGGRTTYKLLYGRLDAWRDANLARLSLAESRCDAGCDAAYTGVWIALRGPCKVDCIIGLATSNVAGLMLTILLRGSAVEADPIHDTLACDSKPRVTIRRMLLDRRFS